MPALSLPSSTVGRFDRTSWLTLAFVLSFLRRVWSLTRWPRAVPGLLPGLPLAALVAVLTTGQRAFSVAALGLGALGFLAATSVVTPHTLLRMHDAVMRTPATWLGFDLVGSIGVGPVFFVLSVFFPPLDVEVAAIPWIEPGIEPDLLAITGGLFAACLSITITCCRLLEIDVLIKQALLYATLTVQGSERAIITATLAGAALFLPLRAGCKISSAAASTATSTTPPRSSRLSMPACGMRSN